MKTKILLSIALTCAISVFFITISPVLADFGVVPTVDIPVFESEQKAIVAWNGSVETMIISTDVNATENTAAIEILPLPSNPEKIEAGDLESFNQIQNLIELHAPTTSRYGEDVPGSPGINITFQEKIGAHNITIVEASDAQQFMDWIEDFLGNNGIEYNISSTELEPLVANYINRGMNFFVFDLIELNTSERSVEPIVYQFQTDFLYYPLEISSIASGNTEISLFTVTNDKMEKSCVSTAGFDIVNYTWKGYPRPAPVPVEFAINKEELGNISSCAAELFEGDAWFTAWRYNGSIEIFGSDFMITASASAAAPPTPFLIYGWVNYSTGKPVNNPNVTITNLNTSDMFNAETNESSNYYQILISLWNVSADDVLHIIVSDNGNMAEFNRTVTLEDINNGGIFDFNITLEVPTTLTFDTGKPANPYPSIFGTHNGSITPNVTIYNVSTLYTYPCEGTGGHTEYVAFYYDPNRTKKITEGHWEGYAAGDWHNITFPAFTMFTNHTYYYTIKTGSYPQIHHTDELPAEEGMGIINCTSFVDANGKRFNDWIPAIRLEGYSVNKTYGVNETEWPMFHHDLRHTGCTPATGNASVKDYGLLWSYTTGDKILSSPVIADLDRDGDMETVVGSYDGELYVFNATGELKWNLTTGAIHSTPAIDDIDRDGELEIVVGSMSGNLYAIDADGKVKWNNTNESWVWMKSSPAIADIDKDEDMEIVVCSYGYGDSSPAIHVLNSMGGKEWQYSIGISGGWSESSPAIADIDKDGNMEIIVGDSDGLYAVNSEGIEEWNYTSLFWPIYGLHSSPAITDIDDDDEIEIIIGSECPFDCYLNEGKLLVFNSTGYLEWNFTAGYSVFSSPAIADLDEDGEIELIFGSCVVGNITFYGVLYVLNSTGQVEWIYETPGSIDSSPAIADLDSDGKMEIIVGSDDGKLFIFNSTGNIEWSYQTGGAVSSSPAIADINNDGNLEIVVGSEDGKIYAFAAPENYYGVNLTCEDNAHTIEPGATTNYTITVKNTGKVVDTIDLTLPNIIDCCYYANLDQYMITLEPNASQNVTLTVEVYDSGCVINDIDVMGTSRGDKNVQDTITTVTTVSFEGYPALTETNLTYTPQYPIAGDEVVITASIKKLENNISFFDVLFYLDKDLKTEKLINVTGIPEKQVNFSWIATEGEHEIDIIAGTDRLYYIGKEHLSLFVTVERANGILKGWN